MLLVWACSGPLCSRGPPGGLSPALCGTRQARALGQGCEADLPRSVCPKDTQTIVGKDAPYRTECAHRPGGDRKIGGQPCVTRVPLMSSEPQAPWLSSRQRAQIKARKTPIPNASTSGGSPRERPMAHCPRGGTAA